MNPSPHKFRSHNPKLQALGLNDTALFQKRSYLQKVCLTFPSDIQRGHSLYKILARAPSLKKLSFKMNFHVLQDEHNFTEIKQIAKKLFIHHFKRITDLQISLTGPLSFIIIKHIAKLKKLVSLKILQPDLASPNYLSCLNVFLSSPRTKKTLTKLQILYVDFTHSINLNYNSREFLEFSELMIKINSSLQTYSHPKSSLHLNSLITDSVVPSLLSMLNSSPHLTSLTAQLKLTRDYSLLLDKLTTLDHLSSLRLIIRHTDRNYSHPNQCFKDFGEYLQKIKALKELELSLVGLPEVNLFIEKLSLFSDLQRFFLRIDLASLKNETVSLLAHSLCSFSNLQSFKLMAYPTINKNSIQSDQISNLFKALSSLKSLKVLHLILQSYEQHIDNTVLLTLCDALENLRELRELKFGAKRSEFNHEGVDKLAITLSKLINLEKIGVDLSLGVKTKNGHLPVFLKSFSALNHLEEIELSISYCELNIASYEIMILLLNQLRNLHFFTLLLKYAEKTPDAESKFEALLTDQYRYQNLLKLFFR